ncbi:Response regulator PleD [Pseudoalteromonas holothuriae]|uniref:diguanylate cyclase n=1 Tax=Pseudoalteromonas holothuriae TaxID=2963714 RepID=A0ABM9GLA4_9GAMM|nr:diguanylate cyclase [Pseudoalteromonas sp. CIP111951]CAH9064708.1 Response regulator PleD [Pseudoalteromonas sp. CIP111951]
MHANILVVEDDDINYLVLQKILSIDYTVQRCVSGFACIEYCELHHPDVILMDVEMPGLNGLETCQALKARSDTKDIPVIFVTSYHQDHEQTKCWQAGASDFVIKPVNALTLRHRVAAQVKLKNQHTQLEAMAFVDGLTQVYNRHYLNSEFDKRLSYAKRNETAFALVIADIDCFKKYNDFYGHLKGDKCLTQVAQLIQSNLFRGEDAIVRYGGDEFVCIVPQVSIYGLETLTNKLQSRIKEAYIIHEGSELGYITLSIGAVYSDVVIETNGQRWLQAVNELLCLSKKNGRNCVTIKEL